MSVEEELKKDHSDMQAVVDSKQKIIDAQVSPTVPSAGGGVEGRCNSTLDSKGPHTLLRMQTTNFASGDKPKQQ